MKGRGYIFLCWGRFLYIYTLALSMPILMKKICGYVWEKVPNFVLWYLTFLTSAAGFRLNGSFVSEGMRVLWEWGWLRILWVWGNVGLPGVSLVPYILQISLMFSLLQVYGPWFIAVAWCSASFTEDSDADCRPVPFSFVGSQKCRFSISIHVS